MLVKVDEAKRLEKDVDWLQEIPLATLIKRGFIQKPAAWSFPPLLCVDLATLIKRGCVLTKAMSSDHWCAKPCVSLG